MALNLDGFLSVSKDIYEVLQPSSILVFCLALGVILLLRGPRSQKKTLFFSFLAITAFLAGWGSLGYWAMKPLEDRFVMARLPSQVDGIIVLGGAFDLGLAAERSSLGLNQRGERMITFASLLRKYPSAKAVFSGGSVSRADASVTEAQLAKSFLRSLGFQVSKVQFEEKSRNTRENALFSKAEVQPKASQTWLLVTSAADMPRAVGSFRAVGWRVVAVPADFHTSRSWLSAPGWGGGFQQLDWATHEWLGLAYYRTRGWSDSFFPGPQSGTDGLRN